MNRLLKSMLITCITIGFSVNNLSAQEAWEELAEQLIDEEGGEVFQWENNFEVKRKSYQYQYGNKRAVGEISFFV